MPTALVVDDEPAILETVGNVLASRGWKVITSPNGTDAVERAAEHRVDVVVSDVVMEGTVGAALVDAVHATTGNADVPIVFMSNMAERRVRSLIRRDHLFVAKPFDLNDLVRTVEQAVDREHAWGEPATADVAPGGYASA